MRWLKELFTGAAPHHVVHEVEVGENDWLVLTTNRSLTRKQIEEVGEQLRDVANLGARKTLVLDRGFSLKVVRRP